MPGVIKTSYHCLRSTAKITNRSDLLTIGILQPKHVHHHIDVSYEIGVRRVIIHQGQLQSRITDLHHRRREEPSSFTMDLLPQDYPDIRMLQQCFCLQQLSYRNCCHPSIAQSDCSGRSCRNAQYEEVDHSIGSLLSEPANAI